MTRFFCFFFLFCLLMIWIINEGISGSPTVAVEPYFSLCVCVCVCVDLFWIHNNKKKKKRGRTRHTHCANTHWWGRGTVCRQLLLFNADINVSLRWRTDTELNYYVQYKGIRACVCVGFFSLLLENNNVTILKKKNRLEKIIKMKPRWWWWSHKGTSVCG